MNPQKLPVRTCFVRLADDSLWSASVALRVGHVARDEVTPGHVYIENVSQSAEQWIAQGRLYAEAAEMILSTEGGRKPQAFTRKDNTERFVAVPSVAVDSQLMRFAEALDSYLSSDMGEDAKAHLVVALRRAIREAAGLSSR